METTSNVTMRDMSVLSRAGVQDPSVLLGTRCVQGDLQVTRGQVRPHTGETPKAGFSELGAARIRPVAVIGSQPALGYVPFAGSVSPGGIRQT
ncbi:hypothetical protein GCM10028777_04800 [Angustibacter speluncae]